MQNRIDAVMAPDQINQIKAYFQSIINALPESGNLTLNDDERGSLTSLDVDNKIFVEDAVNEIRNNGQNIIPPFISAEQLQNDLTLFEQMDELRSIQNNVQECIEAILRIAATEAYGVSNAAYQFFKSAAEAGIPNAQSSYDKLKQRYKPKGGKGNEEKPLENQ
ncbi:hypothetical protein [Taibaiella lutea]|nr:hypothetical protein [Taibaiella lutea]